MTSEERRAMLADLSDQELALLIGGAQAERERRDRLHRAAVSGINRAPRDEVRFATPPQLLRR